MFSQNLLTMNNLDPIFYRTLFYDFRPVIPPGMGGGHFFLVWGTHVRQWGIIGVVVYLLLSIWRTPIIT
jgi:hypothetical protein